MRRQRDREKEIERQGDRETERKRQKGRERDGGQGERFARGHRHEKKTH